MSTVRKSRTKEAEDVKVKSKHKRGEDEIEVAEEVPSSRVRKVKRSNTEHTMSSSKALSTSSRNKDDSEIETKKLKSRVKEETIEETKPAPESTFPMN
jgi:hypothetical protein